MNEPNQLDQYFRPEQQPAVFEDQIIGDALNCLRPLLRDFVARRGLDRLPIPVFQKRLIAQSADPLSDFEIAFLNALAHGFDRRTARFVEFGSGLGLVPVVLSAAGFPATGFEGDFARHAAALDLLDHLRRHKFPGADRVSLHFRHLPLDAGPPFNDTIPIVSNLLLAPQYVAYPAWLALLRQYRAAIVNLDRFIERRSKPQEQQNLIEKLAAGDVVALRAVYRADKGSANFVLFANRAYAAMQPEAAAEPDDSDAPPGRPNVSTEPIASPQASEPRFWFPGFGAKSGLSPAPSDALAATHTISDILVIVSAVGGASNGARDALNRSGVRPSQITVVTPQVGEGSSTWAKRLNEAVRPSAAHYFLFLDDDLAVTPGCIAGMRRLLANNPNVGVVGAVIADRPDDGSGSAFCGYEVGIAFMPVPAGRGRSFYVPSAIDATGEESPANATEPIAVSGALMMVRCDDFERAGGFNDAYRQAYADVDLCLSIRQQLGKLAVCLGGLGAIRDSEIAEDKPFPRLTEGAAGSRFADDRALFLRRFGAIAHAHALRSAVAGSRSWRSAPPRLVIVAAATQREAAIAVGGAWAALFGWDFSVADPEARDMAGADVIIVFDHTYPVGETFGANPGTLLVAWIGNNGAAWRAAETLNRFPLLLSSSRNACDAAREDLGRTPVLVEAVDRSDACFPLAHPAAIKAAISDFLGRTLRIGIKIGVSRLTERASWGDFHFALGLKRAFERLGCYARIDCMAEWYDGAGAGDDVVIVIRGPAAYHILPGPMTMIWLISHPHASAVTELANYDHVFVASESCATKLAGRFGSDRVSPLLQCTDPSLFHPSMPSPVREQVLFIGNTRGHSRPMIDWALRCGVDFRVFGRGWRDKVPAEKYGGEHVPNDELGGYYGNSNIVLNDHWPDMRDEGFLSNRLFDAGAAGAAIVSDEADGLRSVFGDLVDVCGSADDLKKIAERLRRDWRLDQDRREALRRLVVSAHTFDHRARAILDRVRNRVSQRRN